MPAWLLFTAATWFWHLPPIYELRPSLGRLALSAALSVSSAPRCLFWYPVIRPYPSRPSWSPWLLIPYLILADVQNTLLSAVLTFSDQPLYSYYVNGPRLGNLSPLDDQAAAGVAHVGARLAGVPGAAVRDRHPASSSVHLGDLRRVSEFATRSTAGPGRCQVGSTCPSSGSPVRAVDRRDRSIVLRLPLAGPLSALAACPAQRSSSPCCCLPGLSSTMGFAGRTVGAMNLAGVLPWIHWRGLVVLGLLAAGNVFCMACPFMVPRTLARRWLPQGRRWPRWLRNKWLAVVLLVGFLWAYEAFALWDSPWWTAWIVLAYFAAAFVIDGFFRGASFCKYVCPIGQFNFVQSLVSPLEIKVRDPDVCASCRTKDCIRGRDDIPGCELNLYQPRKSSNMDCTFCLDCIHACPHDNVGILGRTAGKSLWHDPFRSGIGRFAGAPTWRP